MYEFYYDYMQPKYVIKGTLCYMDTDNFVLELETEDCLQRHCRRCRDKV